MFRHESSGCCKVLIGDLKTNRMISLTTDYIYILARWLDEFSENASHLEVHRKEVLFIQFIIAKSKHLWDAA